LFEHAVLLEQALEPYPSLRIVLSTSWVLHHGLAKARQNLRPGLRARVIGATFHPRADADAFLAMPRGQQVESDVVRRAPRAWLALDDRDEGWSATSRRHVVFATSPKGLAEPTTLQAFETALKAMHAGGPKP
jgi:hypothetical protein